jgi:hypothetical protein
MAFIKTNPSKISFLVTQNLFQIFFWEIHFQNSTSYLCEVEKCFILNNYVKLTNVLSGCDKNNFEAACKLYEVQHHFCFQWPFHKIFIQNIVFMLNKMKLEFFVDFFFFQVNNFLFMKLIDIILLVIL